MVRVSGAVTPSGVPVAPALSKTCTVYWAAPKRGVQVSSTARLEENKTAPSKGTSASGGLTSNMKPGNTAVLSASMVLPAASATLLTVTV